jgi:hypothetical protein
MTAEYTCMKTTTGTPNVAQLVSITNNYVLKKEIDDTVNMRNDRVYLFSGAKDSVVDQKVVDALQTYYQYYLDVSNIVADYAVDAEHCHPTLDYGENCAQLSSPYLGKCNFDGSGTAFSALYRDTIKPRGTAVSANLQSFSQTPYLPTQHASLGDTGYIYVPTACADAKTPCSLHIAFHGCHQDLGSIGNMYAVHAGYNEWAETNNIIVLYPYAKVSLSMPSNPNA